MSRLNEIKARAEAATPGPSTRLSEVISCDNGSAPGGAGNTIRGLTRSSDYGREGLAMKATRVSPEGRCASCGAELVMRPKEKPFDFKGRKFCDRKCQGAYRAAIPIGSRFGLLTVQARAGSTDKGLALWECACTCGNKIITYGSHLRAGKTTSCGCAVAEANRARLTTHGMSTHRGSLGHPLYWTWSSMRSRCLTPSNHAFQNYGGRGISICPQWGDFETFAKDVGAKPGPNFSLDRIDNDGDYEPGNVRWATAKDQANNRRRPR